MEGDERCVRGLDIDLPDCLGIVAGVDFPPVDFPPMDGRG